MTPKHCGYCVLVFMSAGLKHHLNIYFKWPVYNDLIFITFNTVDIPRWNKIWLILSGRKKFPLGKLILCFASWQIICQVSKYNSNCIIYTKQGTLQTTLTCYNNHNLHNATFKVELCSKINPLIRFWSCQKVHYIKQSSCFDFQSLQVKKTTKLVI